MVRAQQGGHLRVRDDLADLAADELGCGEVGLLGQQGVGEAAEVGEAADVPPSLVLGGAFLVADVHRPDGAPRVLGAEAAGEGAVDRPDLVVTGLQLGELLGRHRPVVGGDGVVGCALEHVQVLGLLGDDRDRLDAGRPGADHPHHLAGEVHLVVGPLAGVVAVAGERVPPRDVRPVGAAEAADGGHQEARPEGAGVLPAHVHGPCRGRVVERRRVHTRHEADIAAQVEAVGHVLCVAEDLRLGCVALRPHPVLLQLGVEAVAVLHALHVAAGTGVAVPVPRAAHVVGHLHGVGREAQLAQPVQHVHAAEPGPDDDYVVVDCLLVAHRHHPRRRSVGNRSEGFRLGGEHETLRLGQRVASPATAAMPS